MLYELCIKCTYTIQAEMHCHQQTFAPSISRVQLYFHKLNAESFQSRDSHQNTESKFIKLKSKLNGNQWHAALLPPRKNMLTPVSVQRPSVRLVVHGP